MQIWKRARQDTWEWVKRHVGITIIVSGLGLPAGFFVLESERAKDELHILLVYTITPISILIVLVFLYNLWLAPYREVWDRLDLIEEHRDAPVQAERVVNTTPANLDDWRHVQELKVYQIAELSGGFLLTGLPRGPMIERGPFAPSWSRPFERVRSRVIGHRSSRTT